MNKSRKKSLKALQQADVPKLEWTNVLKETARSNLTAEDRTTLQEYFQNFAAQNDKCLRCGVDLYPVWGIVNGEANCARCGYPIRAIHRDIGPIKLLNVCLQYHPGVLTGRF